MLTFSFLISHKISTCCPVSRWEARFKNAEGQGDRRNPLSLGQRSSTVLISISDVSVRPHELGALALVEAPRERDPPIDRCRRRARREIVGSRSAVEPAHLDRLVEQGVDASQS